MIYVPFDPKNQTLNLQGLFENAMYICYTYIAQGRTFPNLRIFSVHEFIIGNGMEIHQGTTISELIIDTISIRPTTITLNTFPKRFSLECM